MIRWWIAMLIGAATMCIGYYIGISRARGLFKMAEELCNKTSELQAQTKELLETIEHEQ